MFRWTWIPWWTRRDAMPASCCGIQKELNIGFYLSLGQVSGEGWWIPLEAAHVHQSGGVKNAACAHHRNPCSTQGPCRRTCWFFMFSLSLSRFFFTCGGKVAKSFSCCAKGIVSSAIAMDNSTTRQRLARASSCDSPTSRSSNERAWALLIMKNQNAPAFEENPPDWV